MRDHLVFLLSAPIASFGGYAGHERRGSEIVPFRSAILGLVGAAIGIDRADADGQNALREYSVAVQSFQESSPLRDYHTVETVPTSKAKRPSTRLQALSLAGDATNVIITLRDYRCDVLLGVALWGKGQWSLASMAERLRHPEFPIYLGRKSCPLSSPLSPIVVIQAGPAEALNQLEIPKWLCCDRINQDRSLFPVYSDPIDDSEPPNYREVVPGEPIDRGDWTFSDCEIWRLSPFKRNNKGDA